MLKRGCTYSYVNRKLRQLGAVLALWVMAVSAIAAFGGALFGSASLAAFPRLLLSTLKGTLLQSGLLSHCWFLWALGMIYVLLPPISKLSLNGKKALFAIMAAVGIALQVASCFIGHPLETHVPQAFRIWIWLEYFLLGGLVYLLCKKGLSLSAAGTALAAASLAAVAWQLFAGSVLMPETTGAAHAEYFYDSVTCVAWCAVLFMFVCTLKPGRRPWVYLGSLTMGVYLLHKLQIRALGQFVSFADPVWGCGLGFLVVLAASFAIIAAVKKLLPKVFELFCAV